MRQLVLIASTVALFLYMALASQTDAAQTGGSSPRNLLALAAPMEAVGAQLEHALLIVTIRVDQVQDADHVRETLGWNQPAPKTELREATLRRHQGGHYLTLRWCLSGESARKWPEAFLQLQQVSARVGPPLQATVQLEGSRTAAEPAALTRLMLASVSARPGQPWQDSRAASTGGWSLQLPAGPYPVNIQVAARTEPQGNRTRVWVAWPALQQEY